MVQVISKGCTEKTFNKKFKCDSCGCVFVTNTYTRELSMIESPDEDFTSNCPRCYYPSKEFTESLK